MYRLASLLTLLIALIAVGCGGSGDDSDSAPAAVADAHDGAPSDDDADSASAEDAKKKENKNDGAAKASEDGAKEDDEPKSEHELLEEQEEAFKKLPPKRKLALVEAAVRSALLRWGLELVDVELTRGGRRVNAVVARKGACNFVASEEPNLVVTIKHGAPWVKSARFEVAGTGQELGYYVLGCKKPEIPSGAGRVVFEHSGVGGPYSKRFKIETKRWALEWVNEGGSLGVIVVPTGGESKHKYFKPVGSQKPESGRYNYTGRGSFRIRAYGAGGWRIRVKQIG